MRKKTDTLKSKILYILDENNGRPISSTDITAELVSRGMTISERTVRLYLLQMDEQGFSQYIGKRGRIITDLGKSELENSNVAQKIGFLSAKIDKLTYGMDFDLKNTTGDIVVNISLIHKSDIKKAIPLIMEVFEKGFAMGTKLAVFDAHSAHNYNVHIPEEYIGIATVCSITLNGILLSQKIPVRSIYGGLLEVSKNKPTRFVQLISYAGTTLDPLEIFIKSKMTNHLGAVKSGSGVIGASFREVPAAARCQLLQLSEQLKKIGLNGIMEIGYTGEPLHEIPVNEGMVGVIVVGGLNSVAILEESSINVMSKAMSCLLRYDKLQNYKDALSKFI